MDRATFGKCALPERDPSDLNDKTVSLLVHIFLSFSPFLVFENLHWFWSSCNFVRDSCDACKTRGMLNETV